MHELRGNSDADVTSAAPPVAADVPGAGMPTAAAGSASTLQVLLGFARLFTLLAGLVCVWLFGPALIERFEYAISRGRQRAEMEVASTSLSNMGLESLSKQYQMVSKRVGPSVVHISVTANAPVAPGDELTWRYRWETSGQGSGVIVDSGGFILTNYHVVQGAKAIQVSLSEGRKLQAEIVGRDPATDLAVLRVTADNLMAAEWGDSDKLDVGALVWAVGSPFGLQRSITCGILSAKNRAGVAGRVYQDLLQTDAAVNPGNSGGPLVDAQGRVIGINTAIMGESYQGISFAIPSVIAKRVYDRLKTDGRVDRGWIGVGLDDVTESMVRQLKLNSTNGARVVGVYADAASPSPAQQAGLQADDVVVRWNGMTIRDAASLSLSVAQSEIGSNAEAVVIRRGETLTLRVTVARRPVNLD
jgi:S1-C subfamily serine protease